MDKSSGLAPVVDLNPYFQITQWTKGIYEFTNYGNVDLLVQLLEDTELKNSMKNISDLANLNYIKELRSQVDRLRFLLNQENGTDISSVMFSYVKPKIQEFAEFFTGIDSDAKFQYRLAEWFFKHGRYVNGFICLTESIVTHISYLYKRKLGENIDYVYYGHRKRIEKELLENRMKNHPDPNFQEAGKLFSEIKKIRNNAAHAGYFDDADHRAILKKIDKYLKQTQSLFFENGMEKKLLEFLKQNPFKELMNYNNKVLQ